MSQGNAEIARRGYAALNEAYRTGEFGHYLEGLCDPEIVLRPAGILPDSSAEIRGYEGMAEFGRRQADAFEQLVVHPEEFIAVGDSVVVPIRLGGRGRYTGLDVEFSLVHVSTFRAGRILRLDVYATKKDALKAVGLAQ